MKKLIGVLIALMMAATAPAQDIGALLKKAADATEKSDSETKDSGKKKYEEVITKDAVSAKGMMDIHKVKSTYYLEIPLKLMGKPMLLAGRISEITSNPELIAGQLPGDPTPIEWSADEEKVYLLDITSGNICDPSESIAAGFARNNLKPVMKVFPIKAVNADSTTVVIDVSKFFCGEEKHLTPFTPATPIDAIFGISRLSGTFVADMSAITGFKAFESNIIFKTRMSYKVYGAPFTALMTSSIIMLPEKPMRPRLFDSRLGIFTEKKNIFSENKDRTETVRYINRWNLMPKQEDMARYKRGELVVPEKQIVYYIDSAFPEKWRPWLREGIEDWQMAFEEIGFKDAIVARDYPDNPDFDPEDMNNSCLIYGAVNIANAMGPSWVDPRTGEILTGSVYFYHNVLKLLHNWRFVQTSVVDPAARKEVYDMDVMGPLLRYLVAHEIGHTLGLMHNMRGSYAYPVDSLRSPTFTQEYGTTASIMDYARYNYVAQPGDGVTWLLPPRLGLYDKYIIKWAYKPIFEANTPEEEKPILNRWILEKGDDPIYRYGAQEVMFNIDPAASSESLGDDAIKASEYGIKNLKILMENLVDWTAKDGEDYSLLEEMYIETLNQFARYMGHVDKYVGGNFLQYPVHGDGKPAFVPVPKAKQREALAYMIGQIKELPEWALNQKVLRQFDPGNDQVYDYQVNKVRSMVNHSATAKLGYSSKLSDDPYTQADYLDDLYNLIWEGSIKGRELSWGEKNMEYAYVHSLLGTVGLYTAEATEAISSRRLAPLYYDMTPQYRLDYTLRYMPETLDEKSLSPSTKEADIKINGKRLYFDQLVKVQKLLERRARSSKGELKKHYDYLLFETNKALGK